jgi:hypothetical protein
VRWGVPDTEVAHSSLILLEPPPFQAPIAISEMAATAPLRTKLREVDPLQASANASFASKEIDLPLEQAKARLRNKEHKYLPECSRGHWSHRRTASPVCLMGAIIGPWQSVRPRSHARARRERHSGRAWTHCRAAILTAAIGLLGSPSPVIAAGRARGQIRAAQVGIDQSRPWCNAMCEDAIARPMMKDSGLENLE